MQPGAIVRRDSDSGCRVFGVFGWIWDFDTFREFKAVNGVRARGGGIDGPGATVVDGMVYVNSGYAFTGGAPGNVLLAFSVDGK